MKISQSKVETGKTIVITVLVTAIVAFIGGMHYQHQTDAKVQSQAKALVSSVSVKN